MTGRERARLIAARYVVTAAVLAVLALTVAVAIDRRMSLQDLLALLVVDLAAPLTWATFAQAWWLRRRAPDLDVVRERAVVAFLLAVLVTVFAIIFLNNGMPNPYFAPPETQLITRGTLLVVAVVTALRYRQLYDD